MKGCPTGTPSMSQKKDFRNVHASSTRFRMPKSKSSGCNQDASENIRISKLCDRNSWSFWLCSSGCLVLVKQKICVEVCLTFSSRLKMFPNISKIARRLKGFEGSVMSLRWRTVTSQQE
ncbi:hypothetical protein L5515_008872 [Caenorhabditis briggsae]|uniref:Uncharacterized protein n=1 Tax=Caenorhabditis briggsae TaxID=6238 RepID=A0AAE9F2M5_CAEBR|nr:hypothetical protein L5515_008872 [Caenorhabditis briggsae]